MQNSRQFQNQIHPHKLAPSTLHEVISFFDDRQFAQFTTHKGCEMRIFPHEQTQIEVFMSIGRKRHQRSPT